MRDFYLGVLMALSIALLTNFLKLSESLNGQNPSGEVQSALFFFFAAGAVSLGLARLGISIGIQTYKKRGVTRIASPGGTVSPGLLLMLVMLAVAGVLASGFFIAILELGPSVAETLESGLAPLFYLIFYLAARRRSAEIEQVVPNTGRISWGALLIACGLICLGLSINLNKIQDNLPILEATLKNVIPVAFGVVGAVGSALSVLLTRSIKKEHDVPMPLLVLLRYSGVAVVYFLLTGSFEDVTKESALLAFCSGAVLIHLLFFFMVNITGDLVAAASLGLAPVLTLAIEFLLSSHANMESKIPFEAPGVWVGVVIAMIGIFLLEKESDRISR